MTNPSFDDCLMVHHYYTDTVHEINLLWHPGKELNPTAATPLFCAKRFGDAQEETEIVKIAIELLTCITYFIRAPFYGRTT